MKFNWGGKFKVPLKNLPGRAVRAIEKIRFGIFCSERVSLTYPADADGMRLSALFFGSGTFQKPG